MAKATEGLVDTPEVILGAMCLHQPGTWTLGAARPPGHSLFP